ncbi:hypothetical protein MPSEU_000193000 [Mayamaea pseudoterrestris]|nr:hypothetical protein MPSEU_000193000 [Mayamaea pseudoterrestris]
MIMQFQYHSTNKTVGGSSKMKVLAFMCPRMDAFTCRESDPVSVALNLIVREKVSAVVVLKENDTNRTPVGLVTKSDLVKAYQDQVPLSEPVQTIMNKEIAWLNMHDSRDAAAKLLEKTFKHHALVKDSNGNWVGIISSWDIAAECAKDARAWPWTRHDDPVKVYTATGFAH